MTHRSPAPPPEQRSEGVQRQACANFLSVLSLALFGIFTVTAAASALPLQPLQPDWQLRLGTSLIDNGPIAALALVAAWLAVILSQVPGRHEGRLAAVRQWAIAAALGYLLLIPLLSSAAWRGLSQVLTAERQEQRLVTGQLASLRAVVRSSPTATTLARQWRGLNGPRLSTTDLEQPLPQLRAQLLDDLQQIDNRIRRSGGGAARQTRVWGVVQNTLRLCLSALFLALGFAAAAKARGRSRTLLEVWQDSGFCSVNRLRVHGPRRSRIGPACAEDAEYLEAISPRD